MFETIEVMIALAVVYLIFSMILKYLMSVFKRLLKTKADVIAKEMKQFFGEQPQVLAMLADGLHQLGVFYGTAQKVAQRPQQMEFMVAQMAGARHVETEKADGLAPEGDQKTGQPGYLAPCIGFIAHHKRGERRFGGEIKALFHQVVSQ